jgi:hypothetical protein
MGQNNMMAIQHAGQVVEKDNMVASQYTDRLWDRII